jgi:pimeloyl-ACP methyl ester carboxylesterase
VTALAFDLQGEGADVVLLLHGIGGGRSIWGDAASGTTRAIAALGCRAVAVDLPGYGDSVDAGEPTLQGMVQALVALAAELAPRRLALVGHSMGGMIAQELVALHPALPQVLVLTCTSSAFGKADGAWQARFVADRLAPLDAGLGMAGMAWNLVPGMLSPGAVAGADAVAIELMSRVPEATYRTALKAIAAFDRRAALPAITQPTLCLAGEHDRTAPPELMQRMAERIPGAQFAVLSNAGHIANVEQPAAFNQAVTQFLKSCSIGS